MNDDELEWFLLQRALPADVRRYYHLFCSISALQSILSQKGLLSQEELDKELSEARVRMRDTILEDLKRE